MPLRRAALLGAMLALGLAVPASAAKLRPLVSVLSTCSSLTPNTYPADSMTWFDASKQAQIVLYAHLLFPLQPEPGAEAAVLEAWHPPMAISPTASSPGVMPDFNDEFYAQAEWLDPAGKRIALYGLTLSARIRSDYVQLKDRWYVPHTLAMAIGTRDLRSETGQIALPDKVGQYHIRLSVDGQSLGLAFFRMLHGAEAKAPVGASTALTMTGKATADAVFKALSPTIQK